MRYTDTHVYFFTDEAPFSNFYKTHFYYKGYNLLFSEQGFMIEKALLFDKGKASLIAYETHPYKAKMLGRQVRNYNKIWGVKIDWKDDKILDEKNYKGLNLLGKALMQVRNELK